MNSKGTTERTASQYLEPELYFLREERPAGTCNPAEAVEISQFVRKGALLADFPNYAEMKSRGFLRSPLQAGPHVEFNADKYSLTAGVSGYPRVGYARQEKGPDILVISIHPIVRISHNKMKADFILCPSIAGTPSLEDEEIEELIAEAAVVHGIDREAVARARQIIRGPCDDFEEITFAKGRFPEEGRDAQLQFEMEVGPLAGYMLEDGTIDFRDRKVMVGVKNEQHIATKIPAISGTAGCNVLGHTIEPKGGRDIHLKLQGEVRISATDNRILATADGALSVVNREVIKVASKITVPGDVDYITGNIESENHAVIKGSIQPGFRVEVGGDLEIAGAVSSAAVHSGGNTVIKGGITGKSSLIASSGDIDLHFVERGVIRSGGLVVIRRQCYYSSVEASSDIRCHPDSSVLGGKLLAGGSLTVGNVGAENCESAILGAGVDPGRYLLYRRLQKEYLEQQSTIIQTLQLLGRGARPKKIQRMEEAAEDIKIKILKLNLIPGTDLYSRRGQGKDRQDLEEEDPLYLLEANIENIRIEIHGRLYAGTQLLLGNRSLVLTQNVENRGYRLSKNLKRIMAVPL